MQSTNITNFKDFKLFTDDDRYDSLKKCVGVGSIDFDFDPVIAKLFVNALSVTDIC